MKSDVRNTSETLGTVKNVERLFSGQENTFVYNENKENPGRPYSHELGQNWDDVLTKKIEGVGL